jgi:spermidine synthase
MSTLQHRLVCWSVIGVGISSVNVQLVTVREFLSQFQGNELTISLTLFCWLAVTGLGSLTAKSVKTGSPTIYGLLLLFLSFWPLVQIVLIRTLKETFFTHGASAGFYPTLFFVLALTAPYCLVVGFILPHALTLMNSDHRRFTSAHLYQMDSTGDIAGGALFTFALVYWLKPFAILAVTSSLSILLALLLLGTLRKVLLLLPAGIVAFVFFLLSLSPHFEWSTLAGQYGEILQYVESPFGRIVVTREGSQHTFWASGLPLFSDADTVRSEEKIHYPLSQLGRTEQVLLVSGVNHQVLEEVLKHRPESIDYVEPDPDLTRMAERVGFLKKTPELQIIHTDARRYIRSTPKRYDAVIVDLPEPDTYQINRFFTSEFFKEVKRVLSEGGLLSFGSSSSENYLSEVSSRKLATLYRTAKLHFQNVLVLPGNEAYFLCRDRPLRPDVVAALAEKSVMTSYVEGSFRGTVTADRVEELNRRLAGDGPVNTDLDPKLIQLALEEWFALHGHSPFVLLSVLLGGAAVYLLFLRREEYLLFSSGLVAMGAEMLVLFSFQVIHGFVYKEVGAIITAFLLGLLPGSFLGAYAGGRKRSGLIFTDLALLLLLVLFLVWLQFFRSDVPPLLFLAYGFSFSLFCGYQFPLATGLIGEEKSPAAGCLGADLVGASVGTLAVGALIIPLWGLRCAIIFLILVKISSNMAILFTKRRAGL